MIFITNKYNNWYYSIIKKARNREIQGYTEKHHIVPKSIGGINSSDNIVRLTAREHFICHVLLTKMTLGKERTKMLHAVGKFIQSTRFQKRKLNSREYEIAKKYIAQARIGSKHTESAKQKMSNAAKGRTPWNKGLTGIIHSPESNEKRSKTQKGKSLEEKVGIDRAVQIKQKISNSKMGKPSGMRGKTHPSKGKTDVWKMSEEGKKKISVARQGIQFTEQHLKNLTEANKINGLNRRGIPHKKITCPHCGKTGSLSGIKRYHFTNCKDNLIKK
jgi:hypothetical protein